MEAITVDRLELIKTLKANRDEHREMFEEALGVYRERVVEELERHLDDAKNGRKISRSIGLVEPRDYTDEYSRVIAMLEWDKNPTVQVSEHDFGRYVLNDWEWREAFAASTGAYLSM